MERKVLFVMLVLAPVFSGATVVLAWDPPSAGVEGRTQIEAIRPHGDDNTGGVAYGAASGNFKADGEWAEGVADAQGRVRGRSSADESSAFSKSAARVGSSAYGAGNQAEVRVNGIASQGNWGSVDRGDTGFISGGNLTGGSYEGIRSGTNPFLEGGASADGKTRLQATDNSTRGNTRGNSKAWLASGCGDPVAKGEGILVGGNAIYRDGTSAITTFSGDAKYSASGPSYAGGGLEITGGTEIKETPNGISIKSGVKAGSWSDRQ